MKRFHNIILLLPVLYALGILHGCSIKEDMSDCPEITIRLYHDEVVDINGNVSNIDHATIFVFDDRGVLVDVYENKTADFNNDEYITTIPLNKGNYRFVAFRGLCNSYTTEPAVFVPGVTTFDEAVFKLTVQNGEVTTSPSHIFTGSLTPAQVKRQNEHFDVLLQQLTYTITVRTTGLAPSADDYSVIICDNNSDFKFDNTIAPCASFDYISCCEKSLVDGQPFTSLVTLQLKEGRHPDFIFKIDNGDVLFQDDLMKIILDILNKQSPGIAFADAGRRFDIVLHFDADMGVTVTINNWVPIYDNPDF